MRPGISIQHSTLPSRTQGVVRCDIGAMIGFIVRDRWPAEASAGDFIELTVRRFSEVEDSPHRPLLDPATLRAAQSFFENGGDILHLFAVCIESLEDLRAPSANEGAFAPLFHQLRNREEIGLISVPAASYLRCEMSRTGVVRSEADPLYRVLLAHCREMINRFLIIDAPKGLHGELLSRWFEQLRKLDPHTAAFGAVYYPWLMRGDTLFPPSGAVMGMFARSEREHGVAGVGWPPANVPLNGATHTEVELDWGGAGEISESGINPIVVQPGRGAVVFGARTMSQDPAWVFVNSRRIVSMITEQLRRDNEWAVFEVNNRSLWKVMERDVLVRLEQFWRSGILSGDRPQAEYSVECSDATNPVALRDAGQLNVRVSLRPVSTTERILIDLRLGSSEP